MGFFDNVNNALSKEAAKTKHNMERKARTLSDSDVQRGLRNSRAQGNSAMEEIFQKEANRRNLEHPFNNDFVD